MPAPRSARSTDSVDDPECAWCSARLDLSRTVGERRVECTRCAAQTTWPPPSEEELQVAYEGWYRPDSGRFSGAGDAILRRLRSRLALRLDELAPPGRVLDVGAGDGTLLDALRATGRPATGLERQSSRPDVLDGELADVEGSWAAVVFWHSLEHIPRAGDAIARAGELLQADGALVVALPNPASLQARAFGDRWLAFDLPRHLVHVPKRSLIDTIEALGLRVERVSGFRGGQVVFGWLHGLVGLLPGNPDLYDAIRRPEARRSELGPGRRLAILLAAVLASPFAAAAAVIEVALGRSGTSYVEARGG